MVCSDTYVPLLQLNYFDNFTDHVSQTQPGFPIFRLKYTEPTERIPSLSFPRGFNLKCTFFHTKEDFLRSIQIRGTPK